MTLRMLKENIAGNLNRYLVGRHDEGKKRIARNANAFVSAAESFSDLAAGLDAYRTELLRYVANRNRRRMFAHRAGALERYLRSGIAEAQRGADAMDTHAALLLGGMSKKPGTTVKDWNRHGGGKNFVVNGVGYSQRTTNIAEVDTFCRLNGISNPKMRVFLCDFANQDALFASAHLFSALMTRKMALVNFCGMQHRFESTRGGKTMFCRHEARFSPVIEGGTTPVMLDPPLAFIQTYQVIEDSTGKLALEHYVYDIQNSSRLSQDTQTAIAEVLSDIPKYADGRKTVGH